MKKTTVYLQDDLYRQLKDTARRTGQSEALMIREALAAYLVQQARPWPKSIGMVSDGTIDAAAVKDWIHTQWDKKWAERDLEREHEWAQRDRERTERKRE